MGNQDDISSCTMLVTCRLHLTVPFALKKRPIWIRTVGTSTLLEFEDGQPRWLIVLHDVSHMSLASYLYSPICSQKASNLGSDGRDGTP
jgi:hypothetical protein